MFQIRSDVTGHQSPVRIPKGSIDADPVAKRYGYLVIRADKSHFIQQNRFLSLAFPGLSFYAYSFPHYQVLTPPPLRVIFLNITISKPSNEVGTSSERWELKDNGEKPRHVKFKRPSSVTRP